MIKCRSCETIFATRDELKAHFEEKPECYVKPVAREERAPRERTTRVIKCRTCETVFATREELKAHFEEKPECYVKPAPREERAPRERRAPREERAPRERTARVIKCRSCETIFATRDELKAHFEEKPECYVKPEPREKKVRVNSKRGPGHCDFCNEDVENLLEHENEKHGFCYACFMISRRHHVRLNCLYKTKAALEKHEQEMHICCKDCGHAYETEKQKLIHIVKNHPELAPANVEEKIDAINGRMSDEELEKLTKKVGEIA